ncbi:MULTISPECIES: LLM class flavin-dependent oxidoreductase [Brucella]|uniref:LLM class flavin-dependent oxidoreductase n=1 Tax=Brucella TaxID=234 RepID=UPI002108109F|nr:MULTISPECIES: LLM class flavin-dependent oxidoreductase [Brucella]
MRDQPRLARRAEELGFTGLWTRDVPMRDPNFGDLGQVYDPWVWLGWIAAHTSTIALATGSIILPLRHPLHTAKASASVDQLTGGRFVLGVASGDRPVEFPAFGVDWHQRDRPLSREPVGDPQGAHGGVSKHPVELWRHDGNGGPRAQTRLSPADPDHRFEPPEL